MKNAIHYPIIIALMMVLSMASCKENKAEAGRISECAGISGGSMEARTDNCWSCCVNNGWDRGVYWEVGDVGCECRN